MVAAVELHDEAGLRVVEVGPRTRLGNRRLNMGAGQAGLQEKPAQSCLHRRLSWLGQRRKGADIGRPRSHQGGSVDESQVQSRIQECERIDAGESGTQVGKGAIYPSNSNVPHFEDVGGSQTCAPYVKTATRPHAGIGWHNDLDRVEGIDVLHSMYPGRSPAGEDR